MDRLYKDGCGCERSDFGGWNLCAEHSRVFLEKSASYPHKICPILKQEAKRMVKEFNEKGYFEIKIFKNQFVDKNN